MGLGARVSDKFLGDAYAAALRATLPAASPRRLGTEGWKEEAGKQLPCGRLLPRARSVDVSHLLWSL